MVLENNLVAYYKLEEASGSNRADAVGSADLTEALNPVASGTGKLNNGADIAGANRLRAVPSSLLLDDTFSVSFWVNWRNSGGANFLLSHSHGGQIWSVWVANTGVVHFEGTDGASFQWNLVSATGALTANQFEHVVLTRVNNSGDAIVYINGSSVVSTTNSGTTNWAVQASATDYFTVGARNDNVAQLDGIVDEIGYWNRAITQAEVTHLYSVGQGAFYDNTVPNQFDPEVPICWNYTAPYKGSDRRFKLSGPGAFPKSLNVPGNVDTSQGKMIDNGQLIDPDEYEV